MFGERRKSQSVKPGMNQINVVSSSKKRTPELDSYIEQRDYSGALAILDFTRRLGEDPNVEEVLLWIGYCFFHSKRYQRALETYQEILQISGNKELHLYIACCYLFLKAYESIKDEVKDSPACELKSRLLLHAAQRQGDEAKLKNYLQMVNDSDRIDQLSLAAVHYSCGRYKEASDIYKRILVENRDNLALNVYVAMCYYKLDYYDVSMEILAVYLHAYPSSALGINLKACNLFRLYNGKSAETELKALIEQGRGLLSNNFIRHNMAVFSGGQGALQVFPSLMDAFPEARLNLVICHLKANNFQEAYDLIIDLEPSTAQEYILKAIVNASIGQLQEKSEYISAAKDYFQVVGASPSDCDTIPGRQCMASCFFLMKRFEDAIIYLNSIKAYMYNDDSFNWNHGLSFAITGNYKAAEESLLLIESEAIRADHMYVSWLARCYIMNRNPSSAWELYLKMEKCNKSFSLLHLIANDCYRIGLFLYAAKAFDALENIDPDTEYWEGKRGACIGLFQQIVAGEVKREDLKEVLVLLHSNNNPQGEYIIRVMKKWAKSNGMKV